MDWGHLFTSIFKSIFISIPIFICYIALKIKWKEWREGR
jgi:hypothetical protein